MVPAAFVALEALPLTPNGKVDRKALPAPDAHAARRRRRLRRAAQRRWSSAWPTSGRRCSACERVGVHDNFFELGGDSILSHPGRRPRPPGRACTSPPASSSSTRRVAELAARGRAARAAVQAEQGPVAGAGAAHAHPALVLRARRRRTPHHFNQAVLLDARASRWTPRCWSRPCAHAGRRTTTRCACASRRRGRRAGSRTTPAPRGARPPAPGGPLRHCPRPSRPAALEAEAARAPGQLRPGRAARCCAPPSSTSAPAQPRGCCSSSTTSSWTASPGASCWRTWRPPTQQLPQGAAGRAAAQDDLLPGLGASGWHAHARSEALRRASCRYWLDEAARARARRCPSTAAAAPTPSPPRAPSPSRSTPRRRGCCCRRCPPPAAPRSTTCC